MAGSDDVELPILSNQSEVSSSEDHQNGDSNDYCFYVRGRCLSAPPRRISRWSVFQYFAQILGGNFSYEPEDMLQAAEETNEVDLGGTSSSSCSTCTLSPETQELLRRVFEDIDPSEIVDYHVHLVGHGDSGSGCTIHENAKKWYRPLHWLKSSIFMSACQVRDMDGGDLQFISRLIRLVKHFVPATVVSPSEDGYKHGKYCLLPFDKFHEKDGMPNEAKTTFYIPNDYSFLMAREFPEYFYPVGSVNPYRLDAMQELERCARNGVSIIKWLPNSMGIDLRDVKDEFYLKVKELNMALLVHVGEEHSVTTAFIDNSLGNPLFLRKPLDLGVKIIAAHCATEGYAVDIEGSGRKVPCFDLFMRLMEEEKYNGLLFGDISAVCGFLRVGYLRRLLQATHVHDRLIHGSDYPVPAINLVIHTSRLKRFGLITPEECRSLNELYHYNPLLFDFATKRVLRGPGGESFPVSVFKEHPLLHPSSTREFSSSVDPPQTAVQTQAQANSNGNNNISSADFTGSMDVHRSTKVTITVEEEQPITRETRED